MESNPWIPMTPRRPIAEMQGNQMEKTNREEPQIQIPNLVCIDEIESDQTDMSKWQDLLGIYEQLLLPQSTEDTLKTQSVNSAERTDGAGTFQNNISVVPTTVYQRDTNHWNVHLVESTRINQNIGSLGLELGPSSSNTYTAASNSYPQYNAALQMVQNQQALSLSSSAAAVGYNKLYQPHDGFCVPNTTNSNLYASIPSVGASSSTANLYPFAPETPNKVQQLAIHKPDTIEESSTREKERVMSCIPGYNSSARVVLNTPGSSQAALPAQLKEMNVEVRGNGDVEINKTPQIKPPKRKKHRPKVVVEGNPKRTKKASAPESSTPKETPAGKRKYVRKKKPESPSPQQFNEVNEAETSNTDKQVKSCKKALDFNSETEGTRGDDRAEANKVEALGNRDQSFNLNSDAQNTTMCSGLKNSLLASVHELRNVAQQTLHHMSTSSGTSKNDALNAIARTLRARNAILYQNSGQSGYNQVNVLRPGEGASQVGFQTKTIMGRTDDYRQPTLQGIGQVVRDPANMNETRGTKRDYCHISALNNPLATLMRSRLLCHNMYQTGQPNIHGSTQEIGSEYHKRRNITSTPSYATTVKDCSAHVQTRNFLSHVNDRLSHPNLHDKITCKQAENGTNRNLTNWHTDPLALDLRYRASHGLQPSKEIVAGHISRQGTEIYGHNALTAFHNWNNHCRALILAGSLKGNTTSTSPAIISSSSTQEVGKASSNQTSSKKKPPPRKEKNTESDHLASTKARAGLHEVEKYSVSINRLIFQLERISISDKGVVPNEQNALVPYKGDGAIIPFDITKRRKPRPKVDLDPETLRVWDLLMGKEGSESTQTIDKDKEKWWEEERAKLRGRAEAFIAKMHMVQGDRRFSKWKGSVVDSVIGVFLTQNVSDHLSSSAFLSLAARFPVKSRSIKETDGRNGLTAWVEEPEIQVIDPDGTITYHPLQQPDCSISSRTSSEASEHIIENLVKGKVDLTNEQAKRAEEEVVSSQNSYDAFILQTNEEIRSSSGSNSEVEDQLCNHSPNNISHRILPQYTELTAPLQEHQNHRTGSTLLETMNSMFRCQQPENTVYNRQNVRVDGYVNRFDYQNQPNIQIQQNSATTSEDFWLNVKPSVGSEKITFDSVRKETPPLHSATNNISMSKIADYSHMARNISGSIVQETAASVNQGLHKNASLHMSGNQVNQQPDSHSGNIKQPTNRHQQKTTKVIAANSIPAEANAQRQSDWQIHLPSKQSTGNDLSAANARKRKTGDKKMVSDWDGLRKQVQSKSERKGRSKDAMDSIDYEALRHADVKEISDTIRERGMNNMLAERIKDFLDRIVRDHGSIDLEWLRDAPPDKVKEYLLSIRGLGLKSVECVRLLTLHNLAFPVDTNVGRIAVRLGWVPLQPLPESLQLHLLEMYPILETVQKYLWPRLCTLDQKTLYELHYQMITFGKVFCTKSKPNCNACPMRGECRHFASAFASARLALPGPEEKNIVSSSVPISADGSSAASFKQMPLLAGRSEETSIVGSTGVAGMIPDFLNKPMPQPPQITSINKEASGVITSNCEPIIEEPATPELSPEITESDIEDAFYNDDDEIPTIELNMKQFTSNLQTILQEQNMGMQEGDLSKALVALSPRAASIPAPKLKSISHLRTEHYVYELPDSHELLIGLDKREPDDPSPYLLAIWAPGETANSIQPPETKCDSQALGKLCNENACYSCNSAREANSETVRGTILIPCRTATRGSFPLNGTYFQVNEVFADHESSLNPIHVPRKMIWKLSRRIVYFGTSVSTIFKGMPTHEIQQCFWKGFVCVRGFDQKTRAPRPLMARLHFPASRLTKNKNETQKKEASAAERIAR